MLTLILDAAGSEVSVVLAGDGAVIDARVAMGRPLALMHKAIEEILSGRGLSLKEIDRIAVVQGPGSWTGLHIAMDTAKTIGIVSGKPLIPLSRMDAMAESVKGHNGRVVVLLQASRDQFFIAQYDVRDNHWTPVGGAGKGDLTALALALRDAPQSSLLVGDVPDDAVKALEEATDRTYVLAPMYGPSPEALASLACTPMAKALTGHEILDLEPLYMQNAEDMPRLYVREVQ